MANLITVLRTLLGFFAVAMLRWHTWEIYVGAALLTLPRRRPSAPLPWSGRSK